MNVNILIWPFKKNAYVQYLYNLEIFRMVKNLENTAQRGGNGFKFMNSGKRFNVAMLFMTNAFDRTTPSFTHFETLGL